MRDIPDDLYEGEPCYACDAGKAAALVVILVVATVVALSVLDLFWPIAE